MFDFERQLRGEHEIAARETCELSIEQQQRDIFETHRHRVFSVGFYMTADEREAEGILTKTFVQAFSADSAPNAEGVDQALLCELEQRFSLAPAMPAAPEQGSSLLRGQVLRTDLEEALTTLPPLERLVFLLGDVEGYAADRIAKLLRREVLEVQQVLLSARIRMRNALVRQRLCRAAAANASDHCTAAAALSGSSVQV